MEIGKINFDNLVSVRRKCITFAKDGNRVVKPYKTLYCMEQLTHDKNHNNLYLEVVKGKETWEETKYCLFEDLGKICTKIDWIPCYWTLEDFTRKIGKWEYLGKNGLLRCLKESEEKDWHISKLQIELCVILDEVQLATHYAEFRKNRLERRARAEELKNAEREEKAREEEAKRVEALELIIHEAEAKILKQEELCNTEVDGNSIINVLMRRHGVMVPLRTQGWIRSKLAKITFIDGKITYRFYGKSQKANSTVFRTYLVELENAIKRAQANYDSAISVQPEKTIS